MMIISSLHQVFTLLLLTRNTKSTLSSFKSSLFILLQRSLDFMPTPMSPKIIMRRSIPLRLYFQLNRTPLAVAVVKIKMKL
jgi:hypothetical protein